jgi:uncharacterized protein (DUF433 family)
MNPRGFERSGGEVIGMMEWQDRIAIDPRVCHGKPCIKGTRIWVSLIIDNLAAGTPEADILAAYPALTPEDIRAALAYAAEMTRERFVDIPMTATT